MRWNVSCLAFSGFFLRASAWAALVTRFERFVCVDALRDDPALDYARYLAEAEHALLSLPPPYLILGHSYGAVPARSLAQRLPPGEVRLAMIAGLVLAERQSATEAYQASEQTAMSAHCRLNLIKGCIELADAAVFADRLYAPTGAPADQPLAHHEPLALVLESPANHHVACLSHYLICVRDEVADPAAQVMYAARANARIWRHEGGHMGPLLDGEWLEAVCEGWMSHTA